MKAHRSETSILQLQMTSKVQDGWDQYIRYLGSILHHGRKCRHLIHLYLDSMGLPYFSLIRIGPQASTVPRCYLGDTRDWSLNSSCGVKGADENNTQHLPFLSNQSIFILGFTPSLMPFLAYCPLSQMVVDLGDVSLCSQHMEPLPWAERLLIPPPPSSQLLTHSFSFFLLAGAKPGSGPCGGRIPLTGCPGTTSPGGWAGMTKKSLSRKVWATQGIRSHEACCHSVKRQLTMLILPHWFLKPSYYGYIVPLKYILL